MLNKCTHIVEQQERTILELRGFIEDKFSEFIRFMDTEKDEFGRKYKNVYGYDLNEQFTPNPFSFFEMYTSEV